jgi:CRP/FNR family cyclic AMP-dependent transcriptional regulator
MTSDLAEVVADLAAQGARRRYPEGSLIFAEGDNSTDVLLVRSGRVRVVVAHDHHIVDLSDGDLLGEFAAVDGGPRTASAQALTDVELTAIGAPVLMSGLVARGVDLHELTAHTAAHRLRTEARTLAAGGVPVAGVARLLAERAHDGSPSALEPGAIASTLGCSREVVSRALDHLDDSGVVALDRGQVVVLDPDALRAYAAGRGA